MQVRGHIQLDTEAPCCALFRLRCGTNVARDPSKVHGGDGSGAWRRNPSRLPRDGCSPEAVSRPPLVLGAAREYFENAGCPLPSPAIAVVPLHRDGHRRPRWNCSGPSTRIRRTGPGPTVAMRGTPTVRSLATSSWCRGPSVPTSSPLRMATIVAGGSSSAWASSTGPSGTSATAVIGSSTTSPARALLVTPASAARVKARRSANSLGAASNIWRQSEIVMLASQSVNTSGSPGELSKLEDTRFASRRDRTPPSINCSAVEFGTPYRTNAGSWGQSRDSSPSGSLSHVSSVLKTHGSKCSRTCETNSLNCS